jgi:hypothetical protein
MKKYTKDELLYILLLLEEINIRGPHFHDYGICGNLEENFPEAATFVSKYAKDWKHNSHISSEFPVEGYVEYYLANSYKQTLWSKTTKHGRLRWQLLKHIIKRVRKEIKNA